MTDTTSFITVVRFMNLGTESTENRCLSSILVKARNSYFDQIQSHANFDLESRKKKIKSRRRRGIGPEKNVLVIKPEENARADQSEEDILVVRAAEEKDILSVHSNQILTLKSKEDTLKSEEDGLPKCDSCSGDSNCTSRCGSTIASTDTSISSTFKIEQVTATSNGIESVCPFQKKVRFDDNLIYIEIPRDRGNSPPQTLGLESTLNSREEKKTSSSREAKDSFFERMASTDTIASASLKFDPKYKIFLACRTKKRSTSLPRSSSRSRSKLASKTTNRSRSASTTR